MPPLGVGSVAEIRSPRLHDAAGEEKIVFRVVPEGRGGRYGRAARKGREEEHELRATNT